jgi:phage tail sheath gpL-like
MTLPIAVSPGTLTPGLFLTVDLLAGAGTPGTSPLKALLVGPVMLSDLNRVGGNIAADEVRSGGGPDSAATAFGLGGSSHLAAKQIYAQAPGALVDFLGMPAISGAVYAEYDVDFTGTPDEAQSVDIDIAGRKWTLVWAAAEAADDFGDRLAASIMDRTDDLPAIATSDGLGTVTIIAKEKGSIGNDILCKVKLRAAQTNTEVITIVGSTDGTFQLAGGTGFHSATDMTSLLDIVKTKEYAFILPVLSNQEVLEENTVSGVVDHIESHNTGLDAKLEQFIVGSTRDIAQAKVASLDATSCGNSTFGEHILVINGRSLPSEVAARELGGWLATLPIDPAVNRIGELFEGIYGSVDILLDTPTQAQSEDALGNGVALVGYTAQGLEVLIRPVCTHSQDSVGSPDRRLLDCQMVSATYIVARDMRSALPQQFPGAKITPDIDPGNDPPPKNVIEERDIKAFVISRLRFWQNEGVITKASLDASIADGSLSVKVNSSDASQVDIVLPFKIVPPLAKFGVVVQRQPS